MSTISKNVNNINTTSPGFGAVPPLTVGRVYTTNGTAGQFLTSGSNGTNWTNTNSEVLRINQTEPATLEVKGRMVINGVDLEERLKTIEQVLTIPERDAILEKKHPKLKKLYDEYIHALAKYRTFEAIKGDENGTT